jgi:hypothetical protein
VLPVAPPRKAGGEARRDGALPDLIRVDRPEPPAWRRVLYVVGAVLCLAGGIVGWVIPVMTGIPFLVAGVVLLAMSTRRASRVVNAAERRLPESWRRALRRGLSKAPAPVRRSVRTSP